MELCTPGKNVSYFLGSKSGTKCESSEPLMSPSQLLAQEHLGLTLNPLPCGQPFKATTLQEGHADPRLWGACWRNAGEHLLRTPRLKTRSQGHSEVAGRDHTEGSIGAWGRILPENTDGWHATDPGSRQSMNHSHTSMARPVPETLQPFIAEDLGSCYVYRVSVWPVLSHIRCETDGCLHCQPDWACLGFEESAVD